MLGGKKKLKSTFFVFALLSIRSKPFAVHMFAEGLTWQLFTPFALRRLKSRHHKYKSRHPKIDKNRHTFTQIDKIHKILASKVHGVFFLRELKRRRQLRHSRKGLGEP